MADAERDCPDVEDPLRLQRCPDCGYLLCGLPRRGRCPECGLAYEPDAIVLYGWEAGLSPHRRRWLGPTQAALRLWWMVPAAALLWLEPWNHLDRLATPLGMAVTVVALSTAGVTLWQTYRRCHPVSPAPVQLRLTPQGFALRDGIGPADLRPWNPRLAIGLESLGDGWFRLYSEFDGQRIWWWPSMEVRCDQTSARRIRQRVDRWCREAPDLEPLARRDSPRRRRGRGEERGERREQARGHTDGSGGA